MDCEGSFEKTFFSGARARSMSIYRKGHLAGNAIRPSMAPRLLGWIRSDSKNLISDIKRGTGWDDVRLP